MTQTKWPPVNPGRFKVIKFDVPRIRWERTCIDLPLPDTGEIKTQFDLQIASIQETKEATKQDFAEAIAMIEANLSVARRFSKVSATSELEEELNDTVELRDHTLLKLNEAIQALISEKAAI